MLTPSREEIVAKLKGIYMESLTGGKSLISSTKNNPTSATTTYKKTNFPDNVQDWMPKDYVFYFAHKYMDAYGVDYKITFQSDMRILKQYVVYFKSIGVDYRRHIKEFIDWCFKNRQEITKRFQTFTFLTTQKVINEYVQLNILDINAKKESEESYDFAEDLEELYQSKKMLVALKKYGIPIVATFLVNHKGNSEATIVKNIKSLSLPEEDLIRIARASIIRSPYLEDMELLNWRKVFEKTFKFCREEKWWREVDYSGTPHVSYKELIKQ